MKRLFTNCYQKFKCFLPPPQYNDLCGHSISGKEKYDAREDLSPWVNPGGNPINHAKILCSSSPMPFYGMGTYPPPLGPDPPPFALPAPLQEPPKTPTDRTPGSGLSQIKFPGILFSPMCLLSPIHCHRNHRAPVTTDRCDLNRGDTRTSYYHRIHKRDRHTRVCCQGHT